MALASYGEPPYAPMFRGIVRYQGEGEYEVAPGQWEKLFGPPRLRGAELTKHHMDIARSLQLVLEETVLRMTDWLARETGEKNLAMAGGVALNCVMNARVRDQGRFEKVWVQPAAGDSGTSLGAALWTDAQQRGGSVPRIWQMDHAYLGPGYADAEIEQFLKYSKQPYRRVENVAEAAADLLAANKVIGWFQVRMEFGPRALGARSILASPVDAAMQSHLNQI